MMSRHRRVTTGVTVAVLSCVVVVLCSNASWAGTAAKKVAAEQVELFQAIQSGDVGVKLIPKNATQATVMIENKRKQPLTIKLPEAFAGVPVLAQVRDAGVRGVDRGGGNAGNTNQSFGGGMGMGGMGGMGMGGMGMGMGGFFNVAPGVVRKIKVATVCLEHGKPDPNPRVPYELKPIEDYTKDQKVIELCKMLGRGQIDQNSAQAAAWHLTDGLSWQQLMAKVKIRHLNGRTELYFTPIDLQRAYRAVQIASQVAANETQTQSPGEIEAAASYAGDTVGRRR